jgi:hypothetical protein
MTHDLPNDVAEPAVRAPELSDYLELLACLEKLEKRVAELEKRLLSRADAALH